MVCAVIYAIIVAREEREYRFEQRWIFVPLQVAMCLVGLFFLFGIFGSDWLEKQKLIFPVWLILKGVVLIGVVIGIVMFILDFYNDRIRKKDLRRRLEALRGDGVDSALVETNNVDFFTVDSIKKQRRTIQFRLAHLGILVGVLILGYQVYQDFFKAKSITVSAKRIWTPTGIYLRKDQMVTVDATGKVNACILPDDAANKSVEADGWGYDPQEEWKKNGAQVDWGYVLGKGSSLMCLTFKVGDGSAIQAGKHKMFEALSDGELYLGVNDALYDHGNLLNDSSPQWQDNDGEFSVTVKVE
jgi:hypothetical protein